MPYAKGLEDEYYPATLTHDDYPELIPAGGRVDTISVCAVLVSFNWPATPSATPKIGKFVDRFFSNFDAFLKRAPPSEMARGQFRRDARRLAPLAAGATLDRPRQSGAARQRLAQPFRCVPRSGERHRSTPISDAERADLFRAFLEWNKGHNQN